MIVFGNLKLLNLHLNKIISIRITETRHLAVLPYDQLFDNTSVNIENVECNWLSCKYHPLKVSIWSEQIVITLSYLQSAKFHVFSPNFFHRFSNNNRKRCLIGKMKLGRLDIFNSWIRVIEFGRDRARSLYR